jgi:hypothetical protein
MSRVDVVVIQRVAALADWYQLIDLERPRMTCW